MDTKPTVLLAMALFLVSAPDPDSSAVAEITANFVVPADPHALHASEGEVRTERRISAAEESQREERPEPGPDH